MRDCSPVNKHQPFVLRVAELEPLLTRLAESSLARALSLRGIDASLRLERAAIARALINEPRILLADEPTGNLDATSAAGIIALLRDLNRHGGLTIIMVTHNHEIVAETDRVVKIVAGQMEQPSLDYAGTQVPT